VLSGSWDQTLILWDRMTGQSLLVFLEKIGERDKAPDSPDQQFLELLNNGAWNFDPFHTQVTEQRLVHVPFFVERDRYFVNDLQATALPDRGSRPLGAIKPGLQGFWTVAATNKCLARINKSSASAHATNSEKPYRQRGAILSGAPPIWRDSLRIGAAGLSPPLGGVRSGSGI
jgi:hypothetical protein